MRSKYCLGQRVMIRTNNLFFSGQIMAYWTSLDGVLMYVVERRDIDHVTRFIAAENLLESLSFGRTTDSIKFSPGGKY